MIGCSPFSPLPPLIPLWNVSRPWQSLRRTNVTRSPGANELLPASMYGGKRGNSLIGLFIGKGPQATLGPKHPERASCSPLVPCFPSEELKKEEINQVQDKKGAVHPREGEGLSGTEHVKVLAKLDW